MHSTPSKLAGMVGASLVHAGHAGGLEGRILMLPGTRMTLLGNTHRLPQQYLLTSLLVDIFAQISKYDLWKLLNCNLWLTC